MSKSKASKAVGKTFRHPTYGMVEVIKALSFVLVEFRVTERGKHWDEKSQCYRKRIDAVDNRTKDGKVIGKTIRISHPKVNPHTLAKGGNGHREYGIVDICHIKALQ